MPCPSHLSGRGLALIVAATTTLLFYAWSAASSGFTLWPGGPADDYYNRLTDAFLAGQLHLQVEPHPALLALPDPYDPVANAPYRVHDASLYQGKYYLYFGIGPIVSLFLPFTWATGWHLPPALAILLFAGAGYAATLALLRRLRADYFPAAPGYADGLIALMLGVATYVPLLLRRSMVYEVAVAGGFCWSMLMLLGVYRAWHSSRQVSWWLAWVGLCGGLAVACRPNLAPGLSMVVVLTGLHLWRRQLSLRARRAGLLALGLPYAACAFGLMAYNYARFDHPLEFGMRYALAGYNMSDWQSFSLHYLPTSLSYHLISPVGFSAYFPFVFPAGLDPAHVAEGYVLTEAVIGILPALPVVWLGLAVPWLAWRWRRTGSLGWFVFACLLLGLMNLGVHGCFGATTARYQVDFLPPLLLACSAVALAALAAPDRFALIRRAAVIGLLVYSTVFGLLFSLQYLNLLRDLNPALFRSLATWFNQPVAVWERARGTRYGPLLLKLRLPAQPVPGAHETLLHTGRGGRANCIYVRFLPDAMARVGLFRDGSGGPLSEPFPFTPGAEVEVVIHQGSLLPPFGHPALPPLSVDEDLRLRRRLDVTWNGRTVLQASIPSHEATAFERAFARNQQPPSPFADFSGQLLATEYLPWDSTADSLPPTLTGAGSITLDLLFPLDRGVARDPLLAVSSTPTLLLYVQYQADQRLRFGVSRPGHDDILTEPLAVDLLRPHRLEFSTETLHPGTDSSANRLELKMDGELLFSFDLGTPVDARLPSVQVGRNPAGLPAASATFLGRVLSVGRSARIAPPLRAEDAPIGPVIIATDLPLAMIGQAEPLVVTGRPGQGDFVYIRYLDRDHIAFGYDHWGYGGVQSDPIRVDYTAMHRVEVSLGTLYPQDHIPASVPAVEARRIQETVQVSLDGRVVFTTEARPFPCLPSEIYFAHNPLGGSSCRDRFTGRVSYIIRPPWP